MKKNIWIILLFIFLNIYCKNTNHYFTKNTNITQTKDTNITTMIDTIDSQNPNTAEWEKRIIKYSKKTIINPLTIKNIDSVFSVLEIDPKNSKVRKRYYKPDEKTYILKLEMDTASVLITVDTMYIKSENRIIISKTLVQ